MNFKLCGLALLEIMVVGYIIAYTVLILTKYIIDNLPDANKKKNKKL